MDCINKTCIHKTWGDKTWINKTWSDKTWFNKTWSDKHMERLLFIPALEIVKSHPR